MQEIEVFEFLVEGVPTLDHPFIGEEVGALIITESNQKDYYTPFQRTEDECSLIDIDGEIVEMYVNKAGTVVMTIASTSKQVLDDLSNVTIMDHVASEVYNARIIGSCRL